MKRSFVGFVAIAMTMAPLGVAAQSSRDAPNTPATVIHGAPGNTPGFGGSSANPQGEGKEEGGGIHNIGGGAPGQNDVKPGGGSQGGPSNTMHGGLDEYTGRFDRW